MPTNRSCCMFWWSLAAAMWCLGVLALFAMMLMRAGAPGTMAGVHTKPGAGLAGTDPLIVFGAHAECPCTAVGLTALVEHVVAMDPPPRVQVLVMGSGPGFHHLQTIVADLPRATVSHDASGERMRALGMRTSGEAQVWMDGKLHFRGGVTPARGHAGDCRGLYAIGEVLRTGRPQQATPVFGCALSGESGGNGGPS